ncbi:MAG TPA: phosphate ABC transporter permease subunit PstC [Candidatus Brocadiia bacterium]|nr:phosphate ABC transporter permease subunit PstC [Candidatus Brocadiia bacterium]
MDTRRQDALVAGWMRGALLLGGALALAACVGLFAKAWPILSSASLLAGLLSPDWAPAQGEFGLLPFAAGTVAVTLLAMILATPVCVLSALCISEKLSRRWRDAAKLAVDVMAGIPSVVYGLFGVIVVVPFVRALARAVGSESSGYSLLAGGVVLAIMVSPVIVSIAAEALESVPRGAREAALSLGATRWETVRHVLLRHARPGIVSGVIIGFARAFGETMAVMMVVGNAPRVPRSLLDSACPIPALIANAYGEMMSVPRYEAALMLAALALMLAVAAFNLAARLTLARWHGRAA